MLKDYDMSVLYHPGKANVVEDARNHMTMGSMYHVEDEKNDLVTIFIGWLVSVLDWKLSKYWFYGPSYLQIIFGGWG